MKTLLFLRILTIVICFILYSYEITKPNMGESSLVVDNAYIRTRHRTWTFKAHEIEFLHHIIYGLVIKFML